MSVQIFLVSPDVTVERRLLREARNWMRCRNRSRQAFPGAAVEETAGFLLVDAAPLFEKEGHAGIETLFSYFHYPGLFHRSGAGAGFAAHYHPIDRCEIDFTEVFEQRFKGPDIRPSLISMR